jgi:hypothetical protein
VSARDFFIFAPELSGLTDTQERRMESLRLLPPVPLTIREAGKDDWVDGTFVPKGTLFYLPVRRSPSPFPCSRAHACHVLSRRARLLFSCAQIRAVNTWAPIWGADAEAFRPSRWLDLPAEYNPVFSLLSFIAGPHGCIGKTMAISEMKAVLACACSAFPAPSALTLTSPAR